MFVMMVISGWAERFFTMPTSTVLLSVVDQCLRTNPSIKRTMTRDKKTPPQPWTIHEIKLVERHYRTLGPGELQRRYLPHRTLGGVYYMGEKLGLLKKHRMTPWSEEEIELLLRHYGKLSLRALQQRYFPHRTQSSIIGAAGNLGVRRRYINWSDEEFRILQQVYPDGGTEAVRRHLPSLTVDQIAYKASLHGIRCRSSRWTEEEIRQLTAHQHLPLGRLAELFPQRTEHAIKAKLRDLRQKRDREDA